MKKTKGKKGITGRQMCEHIIKSGIVNPNLTAEQIWNASPSGELWHVYTLYEMAVEKIGEPK